MAEEIENIGTQPTVDYTDENIRHLSDMEHVRTRPGMYIGRLGDGNLPEDGIYVLLKEVVDNSIDEFKMNAGKRIEVDIDENMAVSVRDYGRGIPQGKLVEAVSVLNTGGKYDSKAFKKSVGLNGVGVKAVNALSERFEVKSFRDGKVRSLVFERGVLQSDKTENTDDENGTFIFFRPDATLFVGYRFHDDSAPRETFSEREVAILRLLAGGYSNKEIARSLFLAEGTVKNYVSTILEKLGTRDRTRAVLKAITLQVI